MEKFLKIAYEQALESYRQGGIPIGSVLVHKNEVVGRGHNERIQKNSSVLHAEISAIENAGRRKASFYSECALYTTLSPCSMCSGAVLLYKIPKVVIGENKNFLGEESLLVDRGVNVEILNNVNCIELLEKFINEYPEKWFEDIGKHYVGK